MTTDPSLLLAHHAPAQRSRSSRNSSSSSSSSSTTSSILLWLILFIALLTLGGLGYYASLLDFTYYRAVDEMSRTIPRKQDYVVSSWKGGAVQKKNIGAAIRTTQTTTSTLQQTRPLHRDAAIPSSSANKAPTTTTTTTTSSSSSASSSSTTKSTTSSNSPHYHMVFSTSCSPQQDWESFVFFYHAYKVQQSGSVTRIASGCTEPQKQDLQTFHSTYIQSMSSSFHLHLTPQYDQIHTQVLYNHSHPTSYKYMNKPYGLRHWMEDPNGLDLLNQTAARLRDNDIVMLLDPDMILLRPLNHDFTNEDVLWVEHNVPMDRQVVRHGNPISQQDGYLGNQWMYLKLKFDKPPDKDGPLHWNSGPPYLATVRDMYNIAVQWTEWAPKVLHVHDHLFSEMYGLIFATLQLKLPFTFLRSIVVSVTITPNREGWPYVDQLPNEQVCKAKASSTVPLPIGLHYCERYMLGEYFFSKYRIKKNIMSCEKALLQMPPLDLYPTFNYTIEPPRADRSDRKTYQQIHKTVKKGDKQAKREAFMLCHLIDAVNEALRYFKDKACTNGTAANLNETYSVYTDPSNW